MALATTFLAATQYCASGSPAIDVCRRTDHRGSGACALAPRSLEAHVAKHWPRHCGLARYRRLHRPGPVVTQDRSKAGLPRRFAAFVVRAETTDSGCAGSLPPSLLLHEPEESLEAAAVAEAGWRDMIAQHYADQDKSLLALTNYVGQSSEAYLSTPFMAWLESSGAAEDRDKFVTCIRFCHLADNMREFGPEVLSFPRAKRGTVKGSLHQRWMEEGSIWSFFMWDVETLGLTAVLLGTPFARMMNDVWGVHDEAMVEAVDELKRLGAETEYDPLLRWALVESVEAAGRASLKGFGEVTARLEAAGSMPGFLHFGPQHLGLEAAQEHAGIGVLGHPETVAVLEKEPITVEQMRKAKDVVDRTFHTFERLFTAVLDTESFVRKHLECWGVKAA